MLVYQKNLLLFLILTDCFCCLMVQYNILTMSIQPEKVQICTRTLSKIIFCYFSFDHAMQSLKSTASKAMDELLEVFTEMRAHLYLYAGTLLLKMPVEKQQQWRAVVDSAALCYLLAYQVKRK